MFFSDEVEGRGDQPQHSREDEGDRFTAVSPTIRTSAGTVKLRRQYRSNQQQERRGTGMKKFIPRSLRKRV